MHALIKISSLLGVLVSILEPAVKVTLQMCKMCKFWFRAV